MPMVLGSNWLRMRLKCRGTLAAVAAELKDMPMDSSSITLPVTTSRIDAIRVDVYAGGTGGSGVLGVGSVAAEMIIDDRVVAKGDGEALRGQRRGCAW